MSGVITPASTRRRCAFLLGVLLSLGFPVRAQTESAVDPSLAQKEAEELARDTRPGAADFRAGKQAHETSNFPQAAAALKRAAEHGYPRAFWLLGILYEGGYDVPRDPAEARRLFAAGAARGDPGSMVMLGTSWWSGRGGPDDPAQAKLWLQRAQAHPAAWQSDRAQAAEALSGLNDVIAATVARSVEAPKSLGSPTSAGSTPPTPKSAGATPPVTAHAAAPVENAFEPTVFNIGPGGKMIVPALMPAQRAPWSIERAWRQALAAAVSAPSPSYRRGTALVAYINAVEGSTLPPEKKQTLIRARVDELALIDFYALSEADAAFLADQRSDFTTRHLSAAQRRDLDRMRAARRATASAKQPDFAGFPHGTGWAAAELATAASAQQAGEDARRVQALRSAAAKGSPEAMRLLAESYRHGKGVPADPLLALRWMHSAAMRHHIPALQQLGDYCEQGVGLPAADPVQARNWRSAARAAVPPVVSRPRVSLKADRQNFTAYLSGTWEATLRPANGRTMTTRFRFVPTGSSFVLHIDEDTPKPISCNVWLTERQYASYDPRTYKVLNFDFQGRRFEGNLNGGALEGRFPTGTWSANRREDLDYAKLADAAHQERRIEDAIHYYTQAIAWKQTVHHLQRRSAMYYELTDYEPAIADLDAALALDSRDEVSLVNRALAHYAAENHEAAIADATRVLAMTAKNDARALAVRTRALAHYKVGKLREAMDDFAEARKLNPNQPQTREEMLAGVLFANQAINEAHGKMTEGMAKLADDLKKVNEARAKDASAPQPKADVKDGPRGQP
jgi:TPR repeat protein